MTVSSATAPERSAATDGADLATLPKRKTTLGSDDFLKLLAAQFQAQDPLKPMEDTAFIAQMAQFSALDQSKSLVTEMAQLRVDQERLTAGSYLGREVTLKVDDEEITGVVSAIETIGGKPRLVVDGESFPLSAVTRVAPGPVVPFPAYFEPAPAA